MIIYFGVKGKEMNFKNYISKMKKRFKLFGVAIIQNNVFIVMERVVPAYYYLLYDEEEIIERQKEIISRVGELLNEYREEDNNVIEG